MRMDCALFQLELLLLPPVLFQKNIQINNKRRMNNNNSSSNNQMLYPNNTQVGMEGIHDKKQLMISFTRSVISRISFITVTRSFSAAVPQSHIPFRIRVLCENKQRRHEVCAAINCTRYGRKCASTTATTTAAA